MSDENIDKDIIIWLTSPLLLAFRPADQGDIRDIIKIYARASSLDYWHGNINNKIYSMHKFWYVRKLPGATLWFFSFRFANFKVGKINFKVGKINFKVGKINFKVDFTDIKVDFTNFKVDFIDIKVDFSNFKVDFTNFKVDFTNFKVSKTKRKISQSGTRKLP